MKWKVFPLLFAIIISLGVAVPTSAAPQGAPAVVKTAQQEVEAASHDRIVYKALSVAQKACRNCDVADMYVSVYWDSWASAYWVAVYWTAPTSRTARVRVPEATSFSAEVKRGRNWIWEWGYGPYTIRSARYFALSWYVYV